LLASIATAGNYAGAFVNRGRAYADKGEPDRAIEDLDQTIRLNPNLAEAFFNRGNAYDSKGQYDRAINPTSPTGCDFHDFRGV
jgi:tetratricopeptide (TPR) repeat protein